MEDSDQATYLKTIQQKLSTVNPGGPVHKQFLSDIVKYSKDIDRVKQQFSAMLSGSVKHAYVAKCRPEDKDSNSHEAQECVPSTAYTFECCLCACHYSAKAHIMHKCGTFCFLLTQFSDCSTEPFRAEATCSFRSSLTILTVLCPS
jgi:hypothetical protein